MEANTTSRSDSGGDGEGEGDGRGNGRGDGGDVSRRMPALSSPAAFTALPLQSLVGTCIVVRRPLSSSPTNV